MDRREVVAGLFLLGIGVPTAIVLWRGALFGFAAQSGEEGPIGPPQFIYGHPQQQNPKTAKVGNLF